VSQIQIVHEESMLRIATFRNVQINVWTDAPDVHQMRAFSRHAASFCQTMGKSTLLLNAVVRGTPRFPDGVRDEVVKAMKLRGVFKLGAAHLITVGGLAGSATRAFLATGVLLGRPKTPTKVFGDPREACDWAAERAAAAAAEPWIAEDLLGAYRAALQGR
jgi:hypothetical protein